MHTSYITDITTHTNGSNMPYPLTMFRPKRKKKTVCNEKKKHVKTPPKRRQCMIENFQFQSDRLAVERGGFCFEDHGFLFRNLEGVYVHNVLMSSPFEKSHYLRPNHIPSTTLTVSLVFGDTYAYILSDLFPKGDGGVALPSPKE